MISRPASIGGQIGRCRSLFSWASKMVSCVGRRVELCRRSCITCCGLNISASNTAYALVCEIPPTRLCPHTRGVFVLARRSSGGALMPRDTSNRLASSEKLGFPYPGGCRMLPFVENLPDKTARAPAVSRACSYSAQQQKNMYAAVYMRSSFGVSWNFRCLWRGAKRLFL